ncbi:MAG: alpha/beta fold hydrolase [Gemmobacter sp.]|uniref:alpha/beta fold hydrolase n=1 Tax=Gemmobacter sp. TaxID=1898957 RepID=UPI00391AB8B6
MPRDRVQVRGQLAASADAVWHMAGDFLGAWHPAIARIEAEPGVHETRRFTVRGEDTIYRERLTYRSESDRVLAYRMLEGIEGADRYDARLSVAATGTGASVLWTAEIAARADRLAAIRAGTEAVFRAGIDALAAAPPAPPVPPPAAAPAAAIETRLLEGTPRLALSVAGEGGPLVVFLHGIGGGRRNWHRQLQALAPHARAVALDLRGYGDSTLGFGPSTVDGYCDDILRVAAAFGADRFVLAGLSYGAWIATSFAMRHPGRLMGLVLSGGCTGMSEAGPEEREAFRLSREVPLDAGQRPADFAPAVVGLLAGPGADHAIRAELLASMAAIPAETYRDAIRCFTNPLERFDFSRIAMPCLLMTGEHDRLAPPAEIRAVAGRILDASPEPDVRFEVIAGAGHLCNIEGPAGYDRHLIPFVQRVAA